MELHSSPTRASGILAKTTQLSTVTLVAAFAVICATPGRAMMASPSLRFATSIGNHMVLQKAPARAIVWGSCTPGDCEVTVTLDRTGSAQVMPAPEGTWIAKLPATAASNTPHTVTVKSARGSTAEITDVLFGDVWVCSGQSNMAFLLENAFNGSELVADADNHPTIRLFTSKKINSRSPLKEQPAVEEAWSVSSHTSVSDDGCPHCNATQKKMDSLAWGSNLGDDNWLYMSAVCYLYGREMQARTGYPIGLVNTNWGGTPVEFWSSSESLDRCADSSSRNGGAYNGMITPLLNMTIYGVIWYQGEANQGDSFTEVDPNGLPMSSYGCRFPSMIQQWRLDWHSGTMGETDPEFPFGFVSLGPWLQTSVAPAATRWAQTAGYGFVPNPAMPAVFDAIALDLLDRTSPYGSVHIRDKTTVSMRLAAGGAAVAYRAHDVYWQGPFAVGAVADSTTKSVTISFNNTGADGITLKNNTGFDFCFSISRGDCNSTSAVESSRESGTWFAAEVATSTDASLTLKMPQGDDHGKLLVRYGWSSAPFAYKNAAVYSKNKDFPLGPFLFPVQ